MASTSVQTLRFTLKLQVGHSEFPHAQEVDGMAQEEGNLQRSQIMHVINIYHITHFTNCHDPPSLLGPRHVHV